MNLRGNIERPIFTRLKGENHRSRGQRPRTSLKKEFCPARAHQNSPFCGDHTTIIARPLRSPYFFNQRAPSVADKRRTSTCLGLSITGSSNVGVRFDHDRWRSGSCAYSLQSFKKTRAHKSDRVGQKRFVEVYKNTLLRSCRISLAGWLGSFQRKPFSFSSSTRIYFEAGVSSHPKKVWREIRRTISLGLRWGWIALSGRSGCFGRFPRALPSTTTVQAFGLQCLSAQLFRNCKVTVTTAAVKVSNRTVCFSFPEIFKEADI